MLSQEETNSLGETLAALGTGELQFCIQSLLTVRDTMAESRPNLAAFSNALLAILADELRERPGRGEAERLQIEAMYLGLSLADLKGPEPGPGEAAFGWGRPIPGRPSGE